MNAIKRISEEYMESKEFTENGIKMVKTPKTNYLVLLKLLKIYQNYEDSESDLMIALDSWLSTHVIDPEQQLNFMKKFYELKSEYDLTNKKISRRKKK